MFTVIIVSALMALTTAVLVGSTGIVMYTKSCTEEELNDMGIRI